MVILEIVPVYERGIHISDETHRWPLEVRRLREVNRSFNEIASRVFVTQGRFLWINLENPNDYFLAAPGTTEHQDALSDVREVEVDLVNFMDTREHDIARDRLAVILGQLLNLRVLTISVSAVDVVLIFGQMTSRQVMQTSYIGSLVTYLPSVLQLPGVNLPLLRQVRLEFRPQPRGLSEGLIPDEYNYFGTPAMTTDNDRNILVATWNVLSDRSLRRPQQELYIEASRETEIAEFMQDMANQNQ